MPHSKLSIRVQNKLRKRTQVYHFINILTIIILQISRHLQKSVMNMDMSLPFKFKIGNINLARLFEYLVRIIKHYQKFSFTEAVEIAE